MDMPLGLWLALTIAQATDETAIRFLLGPLGLLVFLLTVVVWGGRKRWWVFGGEFADMRDDRDFWRNLAMTTIDAAETSVKATEILAGLRVEEMAREVEHGPGRG